MFWLYSFPSPGFSQVPLINFMFFLFKKKKKRNQKANKQINPTMSDSCWPVRPSWALRLPGMWLTNSVSLYERKQVLLLPECISCNRCSTRRRTLCPFPFLSAGILSCLSLFMSYAVSELTCESALAHLENSLSLLLPTNSGFHSCLFC